MDNLSSHKIDIYDDKGYKEEWITVDDEEEKSILCDKNEATQDSTTWFVFLVQKENYHMHVM